MLTLACVCISVGVNMCSPKNDLLNVMSNILKHVSYKPEML